MKTFASDTSVPVHRSRGEIDRLLQDWGALQVQWGDDWENGRVALRFIWPHKKPGQRFQARIFVTLRPEAELRQQARGARGFSEAKFRDLMERRGRQEHRVLLLWLKAAFNAIELKIISAEELFLPFLEGGDGQTVAEMALPRLAALLAPGAQRLLPAPEGGE